jgi:hypothetical protein
MEWDAQVTDWLDGVLAALRASGLADLVERTVADVWERNVDRFDPAVAGDTATSLGITASENIRSLLLRVDHEQWAARGVVVTSVQQALVLRLGVRRVLLMKVADRRLGRGGEEDGEDGERGEHDWRAIRWDAASDVRRLAAEDNAARYEPCVEDQIGQTWWPGLVPGAADDPERLRHLVLVWAGDPVGATTAGWLGVPYAGPPGTPSWLSIAPVWHHGLDEVPRPREPIVAVPRSA